MRSLPRERRAISVCVDDFGQHEGINRAALKLAVRGRVSAVSCLVDGKAWDQGVKELRDREGLLEAGLHLNLTEDFGQGGCHGLGEVIGRAYVGLLDRGKVRKEIARQFERFERGMGRVPDFVDGHQHAHQLPVIRDELVSVMRELCGEERPWIRSTLPEPGCGRSGLRHFALAKAWLIGRLGGRAMRELAIREGYPQNNRLVGVYGFGVPEEEYLESMRIWLRCASDGDVLACHPSVPWEGEDPLGEARVMEYQALSGDAFSEMLEEEGIEIRPLRGSLGA